MRRTARHTGAVLAVLTGLALAACSGPAPGSIADQAASGDRKGYVSGDGTVTQLAVADRAAPVDLSGTLLDGSSWSAAGERGRVVVLNVWGSWCPPCVEETPTLQKVWDTADRAKAPVRFVGLNVRDSVASATAFLEAQKVTFPSLRYDDGAALLALQGKASAIPSTLVLDGQGRIAARVLGPVTQTVLQGLIDDAVAELT